MQRKDREITQEEGRIHGGTSRVREMATELHS